MSLHFASKAQEGSTLPVTDSFDSSTSDLARQLYLRHRAGETIDKVLPNSIPSRVTARLAPFNVSFETLPGILQRALLWDTGFVVSPQNDAVQIWTLGGRSMADVAVSTLEYNMTGCTAINCTQANNTTYQASNECSSTQILTASKCLMDDFDSDISSNVALWSNGGNPAAIPEIRAVKHGWRDFTTNTSYLLYAVHTMTLELEPADRTCSENGYGSLVVPCYPLSNTSADIVAVMSTPVETPWLSTWIQEYQSTLNETTVSDANNQADGSNFLLLIPIIIAAFIASGLILFAVHKKRQQLENMCFSPRINHESRSSGHSKPSISIEAPIYRKNRTSLRRTQQETIGEFNRTLRLPGNPLGDLSSEESGTSSPQNNSTNSIVPARSRSRSVTHTKPPDIVLDTSSTEGTLSVRNPVVYSLSTAPALAFAASLCPNNSNTITHPFPAIPSSDQVEEQSEHLPTLQESMSLSPLDTISSDPSIRDSIRADREFIPALRETFSRYSAADNIQYMLTTDSNLSGKRIAWERIELKRLLSRGAFGEVWACRYAGKEVAIKRLVPTKKSTFHEMKQFTNEIQLTASLNHSNIVRFIGVSWSSLENLAMVEEYLPRGDLQQYLKRHGDLLTWPSDKLKLAVGIAKALDYLHSRQVIHRDIKARNILLTKRLHPKLIDFGTSRIWASNKMTAGIGTPFWTAPEVLESTAYTEKADIYSFGVLLSELDTCEAPYHDTVTKNGEKMKPVLILKEVVDGTLKPSLSVDCPSRIRKAADACLEHDSKLRPSASELIRLLEG